VNNHGQSWETCKYGCVAHDKDTDVYSIFNSNIADQCCCQSDVVKLGAYPLQPVSDGNADATVAVLSDAASNLSQKQRNLAGCMHCRFYERGKMWIFSTHE
jgi:hypothetical protein